MNWLWKWVSLAKGHIRTFAGRLGLDRSAFSYPAKFKNLQTAFQELRSKTDLASVSKVLEDRFVATATALEALNHQGTQFVRDSERLVGIAAGQSGGREVFQKSRATVEPSLVFLESCHKDAQDLLQRLRRDKDRIVQLLNAKDDLQRTMAPLKFMQTLFKIESAPLGEEVQMMFAALTHDIETLHSQVSDLFGTKFLELGQIQQTIELVMEKLEKQSSVLWESVALEKQQIESSLQKLHDELVANDQREARITRLSSRISREIQEIVVGLQFQDIISQKLQHVVGALEQVGSKISQGGVESLHSLWPSCRLEAEQVRGARNDLTKAEETVSAGIRNVMHHLSKADAECLSLDEFDQLTTSTDGIVQTLLDVIDGVRTQIAAAVQSSADVYETLRPIRSLASGLTDTVRNLSLRIHLIGLNAQVQAAQVGEGTGLEVLSAHTSEISMETNRVSQSIANELDQLVADLARSVVEFEQLHQQAMAHQRELLEQGGQQEQALHALRDDALATLHNIHDLLTGINVAAQRSLENVNYVAGADATLAAVQTRLAEMADLAKPSEDHNSPAPANLLAELERNYTMVSERQVFASVMGQAGSNATATAPASAANEGEIEFFGEPAATGVDTNAATLTASQTPSPTPGSATIKTVALTFAALEIPPASAIPPVPAEGTAESGLGDNVELF